MRRFVLSLAVLGAAGLSACSGGGSVLNFDNKSTPERVIVTVVGSSNIARVLPGAGIAISAVGVRGSTNGIAGNNRFHWSAALTSGGSYVANTLGGLKPCATVLYTPGGGAAMPYLTDYSIYIAIDPTNEANVILFPPPIIPLPSGAPAGSTITTNYPYCVAVTATSFDTPSAQGTVTVAVVNPANPLQ